MLTSKLAAGTEWPSWVQVLKRYVPKRIKRSGKAAWQQYRFSRALHDIRKLEAGETPSPTLFTQLRSGWGNEGWSGQLEYLEEVAKAAVTTTGPILECGSGLTTILMGLLAGRRGIEVWSLEDSQEWHSYVSKIIAQHQIPGVKVSLSPLRDYGDFQWYSLPSGMPSQFELVVCDGPGVSYESRYGLLPVLGQRFSEAAMILIDDSCHMAEIMERWLASTPLEVVSQGPQVSVLRMAPTPARVS